MKQSEQVASDGSTASYYELPAGATELQHLISHKDMNAQMGEIFRGTYRYGQCAHSSKLREAKKIKFYAEAEIARLEKIEEGNVKIEQALVATGASWDLDKLPVYPTTPNQEEGES